MPEVLEMVLRGGAATTFLILTVILLRDGGNRTLTRLGALFCISTVYWALNTPPFVVWIDRWAFPLVVIASGKTAAFWLFSRALFDDGFRMKAMDWTLLLGLMALGGVWYARARLGLPTQPVQMPHQAIQIVLAASAAWVAWKGRSVDLVEPRRRMRIAFVLLSSLFMIGVTLTYIAPGRPPLVVMELNVARMFVMAIGMALLVAGLRSEEMFARAGPVAAPGSGGPSTVLVGGDLIETRLMARLDRLMRDERAYRLEGLTIGALAARVGMPEYALRRLINQRLGYRNFNAYLNGWRLAEARAALLDPAQRQVPISTVALDAGFSSLGPFNRAFKAAEGVTPTEFREAAPTVGSPQAGSPILKSA